MSGWPWLADDLAPEQRVALLERHIEAQGWRIATKAGRLSWANPFTRTIALSAVERTTLERAAVLAHEATHLRQWGGPWWRRWSRAALYFLSRRRRLDMEIEARGQEAAVWLVAQGHVEIEPRALAGWRWPYFTGASAAEVCRRIDDAASLALRGS